MDKPTMFRDAREELLSNISEEIVHYLGVQFNRCSVEKPKINNMSKELASEIVISFTEEVDRLLSTFERHTKCMVFKGLDRIEKKEH